MQFHFFVEDTAIKTAFHYTQTNLKLTETEMKQQIYESDVEFQDLDKRHLYFLIFQFYKYMAKSDLIIDFPYFCCLDLGTNVDLTFILNLQSQSKT